MIVLTVLSTALLVVGLLFLLVSAVGLFRLPEAYTRAHAVATAETLGLLAVFAGLLLRPETGLGDGVRLVVIAVFALLANPTGVHALLRPARRAGVEPWRRPSADHHDGEGRP